MIDLTVIIIIIIIVVVVVMISLAAIPTTIVRRIVMKKSNSSRILLNSQGMWDASVSSGQHPVRLQSAKFKYRNTHYTIHYTN
jgi:hypothetical protein